MSAKPAQEVGAEMPSYLDVAFNAAVFPSCRLFRAESKDARRESMSARAELTASAASLAADASAMAASAFAFASSALAVELVLPSLGSVLGSTSGLVLVVAEEAGVEVEGEVEEGEEVLEPELKLV